jgi:hypothetical protein
MEDVFCVADIGKPKAHGLQSGFLLILLGQVGQHDPLLFKCKMALQVREMTCPEDPKVISKFEFSIQNLGTPVSLLNMAQPLGGHCAGGSEAGAVKLDV